MVNLSANTHTSMFVQMDINIMSVFKHSKLNNNSNCILVLWFTIRSILLYIIPIICFQNFGSVISPTILIFRFCSKEALIVPMAQVPSTSSSIAA